MKTKRSDKKNSFCEIFKKSCSIYYNFTWKHFSHQEPLFYSCFSLMAGEKMKIISMCHYYPWMLMRTELLLFWHESTCRRNIHHCLCSQCRGTPINTLSCFINSRHEFITKVLSSSFNKKISHIINVRYFIKGEKSKKLLKVVWMSD